MLLVGCIMGFPEATQPGKRAPHSMQEGKLREKKIR